MVHHLTATGRHLPYGIRQCYLPLTQANAPALTPAMQAGTRFTYPRGMKGWVDLVDLIAPRPGVEPATFWSRLRRQTAVPPRQPILNWLYDQMWSYMVRVVVADAQKMNNISIYVRLSWNRCLRPAALFAWTYPHLCHHLLVHRF